MKSFFSFLLSLVCVVSFSGCGVKLTQTLEERDAQVASLLAKDSSDDRKGVVLIDNEKKPVDLAVLNEYETVDEGVDEVPFEGVKVYCDEEEKSSDWCADGFIKYRHNIERGCFESYCKEPPKAASGSLSHVSSVLGGVDLEQPEVRLELSFEDLEDIDLDVLAIDQIEEFGRVKIVTNMGDMLLQLHPTKRPATVRNFVRLADLGYLRDLNIYRVLPGFIVQFGEGSTTRKDEEIDFDFGDVVKEGLPNRRGTIAFAGLDLTTFYFNTDDNLKLDDEFLPFGDIVKGIEVLDDIAAVRTDTDDSPVDPLVISDVILDDVYQEFLTRSEQ